jgi:hypothetical protein
MLTEIWANPAPNVVDAIQDFNSALTDSLVSPYPGSSGMASATGIFNSALPNDSVTDTVAQAINQLLRCLTHAADINCLRRGVDSFFRAAQS